MQRFCEDYPSVTVSYLQHHSSVAHITETDESLLASFRLAENIPDPEEREQTLNYLNTLKEKHDEN